MDEEGKEGEKYRIEKDINETSKNAERENEGSTFEGSTGKGGENDMNKEDAKQEESKLDLKEEYRDIIEAKMAVDALTEQTLKTFTNFNPVDRLKDYLQHDNEAIQKLAIEKLTSQTTTHIDMFDEMLKRVKDTPLNLLDKAAEISANLKTEK